MWPCSGQTLQRMWWAGLVCPTGQGQGAWLCPPLWSSPLSLQPKSNSITRHMRGMLTTVTVSQHQVLKTKALTWYTHSQTRHVTSVNIFRSEMLTGEIEKFSIICGITQRKVVLTTGTRIWANSGRWHCWQTEEEVAEYGKRQAMLRYNP